MKRTTIDTAGRWLSPAAAASYQRMLTRGMPAGGIAAAGRTYAQQLALWLKWKAGRGNLAARPGTSLHEAGLALDITRGTTAHTWATTGGQPLTVRTNETIRANEHGWTRTVKSEAWHFVYFPTLDRWLQPVLTLGSTGAWVRAVQTLLRITVDGRYGPNTRAAVQRWQATHGLTTDGKAGPATLTAMGIHHT